MGTHRPPVVMPDMKRRRASTGERIATIMTLARRLPLTRQVLADQLADATPKPDGIHGIVDERRDRIQGTLQTLTPAQGRRIPRRQGARRLRLDPDPLPRRLRARADHDPRLHRRPRRPRPVRPSRHRQDPPRHRARQERMPQGHTRTLLHRRRPGHAAPQGPIGQPGSTGNSPRSAGPRCSSSTNSATCPSTRTAAGSCSRSSPTRTRPRASSTPPTSSSADGAGSSATPTWPPRSSTAPSTTDG